LPSGPQLSRAGDSALKQHPTAQSRQGPLLQHPRPPDPQKKIAAPSTLHRRWHCRGPRYKIQARRHHLRLPGPRDPTTPGWPSVRRKTHSERRRHLRPKIMALPLPGTTPRALLEKPRRPGAPGFLQAYSSSPITSSRQRKRPSHHRNGNRAHSPYYVVVEGRILRGSELPDENGSSSHHRDALVFGRRRSPRAAPRHMIVTPPRHGPQLTKQWPCVRRRTLSSAVGTANSSASPVAYRWGEQFADELRSKSRRLHQRRRGYVRPPTSTQGRRLPRCAHVEETTSHVQDPSGKSLYDALKAR